MENKNSIFQYVIDNSDIVSVIKNYINLEKKGQNYIGLCPFHSDKNPSLVVSPSKKIFKCFVCGESGNVIKFVEKFKKSNLRDSLTEIFKISNLDINYLNNNFKLGFKDQQFSKFYKINEQAMDIYSKTLLESKNSNILNYLIKRKINMEIIKEFKIGYSPNQINHKYLFSIMTNENNMFGEKREKDLIWSIPDLLESNLISIDKNNNYLDFFFNRLMIPIKDNNGNVAGFSGRSLNLKDDIKYLNSKNSLFFQKEDILFNFYNFDKTKFKEIYIVEGYMDVFSLKIIGIQNVIGLMGTNLTSKNLNNIKKYSNIENIVLCLDNDSAGKSSTLKNGIELIKNNFNVFVVKPFNDGIKDANDLINNFSIDDAKKIINEQYTFIENEIYKNDKNLSSKAKIELYNYIFSLLIQFPESYMEKDDDIKKLAIFLNDDFQSMKNKFDIYRKNHINLNDKKNNKESFLNSNERAAFKKSNYVEKFLNNKISLEDLDKQKSASLEKELIYLSINSDLVLNLFFRYYYLNSLPYISKTFPKENLFYKEIVFYLKHFYENKIKISYSNFVNYLKENENGKIFLEDFLNNKDAYKTYSDKEIVRQGFEIIEYFLNSKINSSKPNILNKINQKEILEDWNNSIKIYKDKLKDIKVEKEKYFNISK